MPALPDVPGVLKIVLAGDVDNEDIYGWANVLHFKYSGPPPSDADCATIGSDVATIWGTRMAPQCPSPTRLGEVNVIDLTSHTAGQWDSTVSVNGTRGDDSIPANAAMLMSYPVGTRYRGGAPSDLPLRRGKCRSGGRCEVGDLVRLRCAPGMEGVSCRRRCDHGRCSHSGDLRSCVLLRQGSESRASAYPHHPGLASNRRISDEGSPGNGVTAGPHRSPAQLID